MFIFRKTCIECFILFVGKILLRANVRRTMLLNPMINNPQKQSNIFASVFSEQK